MTNSAAAERRRWLKALVLQISEALSKAIPSYAVALYPKESHQLVLTCTSGWYVALGKIAGRDRSTELQVWLDEWTNATEGPKVCFCFCARTTPPIEKVLAAIEREHGHVPTLGDHDWKIGLDKQHRLVKPLAKNRYGRPLAELYTKSGDWSFVSFYHRYAPDLRTAPPKRVIASGVEFLSRISLTIRAARANSDEFPDHVSRSSLRQHLDRERPGAAAQEAKIRDEFRCKICCFHFVEMYGKLGEGFAEAHHIAPLSTVPDGHHIKLDDLITVCSNCHRMLHRLSSKEDAIQVLRRICQTERLRNGGR